MTSTQGEVATADGTFDDGCMLRTSNHVAGERIILRHAVTAEGDKAFVGLYDVEKQSDCEIVQDAHGTYRCMPPSHDKDTFNRFFLDDRCENEVEYRGICSRDHQAELVSDDPCDQRRRIYAYGKSLPEAMVYGRDVDGGCVPYGSLNYLYEPGPELVPDEYAEVTPAIWRGTGRIWAQGYAGEGGLRIVEHLLDSALEERCSFEELSDNAEHCVPTAEGLLGFTDPTCQQNLLASPNSCDEPLPAYVSYTNTVGCNSYKTFLKATTPYDGERYLTSSCMPAMNMSVALFSTELAPDGEFVGVESTTLSTDTGRLKPRYRTAADGGCLFRDFWDEELQTPCSFVPGGDKYYCLPNAPETTNLVAFTDSTCEAETQYLMLRDCAGAQPPRFAIANIPSCVPGPREIRPVEPTPVTLPALWVESGGDCVVYTPDAEYSYFAVGAQVPNGDFVEATLEP